MHLGWDWDPLDDKQQATSTSNQGKRPQNALNRNSYDLKLEIPRVRGAVPMDHCPSAPY